MQFDKIVPIEQQQRKTKPLSEEFRSWKENDEQLRKLLEGSRLSTTPWDKEFAYEAWESQRRFIASAINRDGTVFDYGCANGFLLRSLQEWSEHQLIPYGFDIDQQIIAEARELFPGQAQNFAGPKDQQLESDFPKEFDFVYWNVWSNWDFEKADAVNLLEKLRLATKNGGRLILGFYETKEENLRKIKQLEQLGYKVSGTLESSKSDEQMIVWFDKVERK